ncbi:MAG: T9SS type A sorting domain-containing protein [Ignavibacteriota bacterium]
MKPLKHLLILSLLVIFQSSLIAQNSKDAAVQIEVSIGVSPHSLNFRLPSDPNAIWYEVYRRELGTTDWGVALMHIPGTTKQFVDATVVNGEVYEYRVLKAYKIASTGVLKGSYQYKITFVTAQGETQGGTTFATIDPAAGRVGLSSIPKGPTGVTKRKIYRTLSGGADGTQKFVATINNNTAVTYTDTLDDASLGAPVPIVNTAMTPPTAPNVTADSGGALNGTYMYQITFVTKAGETNGGDSSTSIVLDSSKVNLSAIAKGPTGTTARNLYRTTDSGKGAFKYVGTIPDNVTTTFTDTLADAALGVAIPTLNSAYAAPGVAIAQYILYASYGYTESSIERPAISDRGKLILLVDKTFSDSLKPELTRLVEDLWNDGWHVIRHDVLRSEAVPNVKAMITSDYMSDPDNTKGLFIFGHVPIPYSGLINPDGHGDHIGAWPADVYYGEFNGDWTDEKTGPTSGIRPANANIPGDGKFDISTLSEIGSTVDLMIGRVDLFDMTNFSKSEKDLLKQYLDKDHAFRTGTMKVPKRALLEDSFGFFGGEAFASSGWRSLAPLVGIDSIQEFNFSTANWMPVISSKEFLWAYGCGGGWDNGAGGAGSTGEFASGDSKAVFMMLFGSYFGDWGTPNNFLRAPLCTSYGLSNAWSGRPYWMFHPMALGEPLGACAQLTQNNTGDYSFDYAANGVHIALMGDPTLVMNPYPGPTGLSVTTTAPNNTATLSWIGSSDDKIIGYNVYRSNSPSGKYALINGTPIQGASFIDKSPLVDTNAYSVRAVKLEVTPSGSYYNLSPGSRNMITGLIKNGVAATSGEKDELSVTKIASGFEIVLNKKNTSVVNIGIFDLSGRAIQNLDNRTLSQGEYRYNWQTASIPSGVYLIRATGGQEVLTAKVVLIN